MKSREKEILTDGLLALFEEVRKKQKLSHQALADKAGVHRSTISLTMRKKVVPSILICFKIAEALGKPLSEFIKDAEKL